MRNHIQPVNKQLNFKKLYRNHKQPANKQLNLNILSTATYSLLTNSSSSTYCSCHVQPANKQLNLNILSTATYSLPTKSSTPTYCPWPCTACQQTAQTQHTVNSHKYCPQPCTACQQTAQPQHIVYSHVQPASKSSTSTYCPQPHTWPVSKQLNLSILSKAMCSIPTSSSTSTYCP